MTLSLSALRSWAHRRRFALRALLAIAAIALLIDGFVVERNVVHLLLLHPLLLLSLMFAVALTEDLDPVETRNEP